jgi:hypothetical protein
VGGESVSLASSNNLEIRTGGINKTFQYITYFENYNSGGNGKEGIRFNRLLTTT